MKFRSFLLVAIVLTISIFLFTGCGSTRQASYMDSGAGTDDDLADIDQLLGLGDNSTDEAAEQNESVDEDEILSLLGVLEEGDASSSYAEEQNNASAGDLSSQVRQLENQQSNLDTKMDNLSRDLNQQSQTISQINNQPQSSVPTTSRSTPAWQSSDFQGQYQEALQTYRNRQYRNAIQKFEALLNINTRHSLSDNCQYWIGESYYGLGDYQQAIVAFEKVFAFTNSNKDDDAQLKLGLCYLKLNDRANARSEFEKLVNSYPTSEYVSIAKRYLASL